MSYKNVNIVIPINKQIKSVTYIEKSGRSPYIQCRKGPISTTYWDISHKNKSAVINKMQYDRHISGILCPVYVLNLLNDYPT